MLVKDVYVVEKSYLEFDPSSFNNYPEKNCLAIKEKINKNSKVRTPKFEIEDNDANTVPSNYLSYFHDLISLNILTNLNALKTDKPELSSDINNSSTLIMTMIASNILNPS